MQQAVHFLLFTYYSYCEKFTAKNAVENIKLSKSQVGYGFEKGIKMVPARCNC